MLPIYDYRKYDSLYNNPDAKKNCRHIWFYFYNEINMAHYGFANLGISKTKHRICEKCFLWQSDYTKPRTGEEWAWMGFGKRAYERLTEEKLNKIANECYQ